MVNATPKHSIRTQANIGVGFGKRNTNDAFVRACNKFVYFDALPMLPLEEVDETVAMPETIHNSSNPGTTQQLPTARGTLPPKELRTPITPWSRPTRSQQAPSVDIHRRKIDQAVLVALRSAINASNAYEEDYVNLADVGTRLRRISPDLNPRNYGFERLRDFVEASGIVDSRMKSMAPHPSIALVRLKEASTMQIDDP